MTHDTEESISLQDIQNMLKLEIEDGTTGAEIARQAGIHESVLSRFLSADTAQKRSIQGRNLLKILTYLELIRF